MARRRTRNATPAAVHEAAEAVTRLSWRVRLAEHPDDAVDAAVEATRAMVRRVPHPWRADLAAELDGAVARWWTPPDGVPVVVDLTDRR